MPTRSLMLFSLAICTSLASAGATPQVLYRQSPAQGDAFVSSTALGGFPFDDLRTADSFMNDGDWALTSVAWWGGDETNSPAPPLANIQSFEITLYNPASFSDPTPGSVIHSETVTLAATNPVATGETVGSGGAPEFRFEHAFESPVLLFFDQTHPVWLSISAN
ncbi:MAG: hypothetical protein ACTS27_11640 [Phycisphaerales bacterium]